MRIIVCVKQVPDTNEVRIDPVKGTLIREGVPSIINPDDKNALEEALKIKDTHDDVEVIVLSMGPPQAREALREAIAMGADEAILLSDRAFAGADTWATSITLASAIEKIGSYDIIFCGRQAIDGDTAQVGPQIGEHLGLPQITYVENLEINGKSITAQRSLEDGYYVVKSDMPVLLTAIKELNNPRYPSVKGIYKSYRDEEKLIKVWTVEDIDVDREQIGLKGSPTQVKRSFTPESRKTGGEMLQGNPSEVARQFVVRLKERQII
ncbi:electron transfer flavoprotein beta subunit [Proteiniborus ethanoligenes]|uniref:Electron transfer flavoprotein small subunit n=1 Tax=Proteiniborus ethanoligenes TaxID=415015 RepID=A0A1H3QXZ8_9FIRM|nr:electron transfer flavoprotein subunit beta/FixA family protein [Proteiniborus ethanoligenes]SDZ18462.1 electron transfer flavoprotein beta subunit [Proteiniborus ethanoligenes]